MSPAFNIKLTILPKTVFRFNTNSIKNPEAFLAEMGNPILKLMKFQGTEEPKKPDK
jgi:hypothetical protein